MKAFWWSEGLLPTKLEEARFDGFEKIYQVTATAIG